LTYLHNCAIICNMRRVLQSQKKENGAKSVINCSFCKLHTTLTYISMQCIGMKWRLNAHYLKMQQKAEKEEKKMNSHLCNKFFIFSYKEKSEWVSKGTAITHDCRVIASWKQYSKPTTMTCTKLFQFFLTSTFIYIFLLLRASSACVFFLYIGFP
jgi:hypothetical protein